MHCLLCLSNSGGHIVPGLAFADYLRRQGHGVTLAAYAGETSQKMLQNESDVIWLNSKKYGKETLGDLKKLARAVRPLNAVVGFGGYIGLLGTIVGTWTQKKVFIFEANSVLGTANKISLPFTSRLFSYFPLKGKKINVIGSPAEDNFEAVTIRPQVRKVLLLAGSLGSKTLSPIYESLAAEFPQIEFTESVGTRGEKGRDRQNLRLLPLVARSSYSSFDLVITRAGGTTVAELTKMGIPFIMIPSPYVKNDHQTKNAAALKAATGAPVIEEKAATTERLKAEIASLLPREERQELHRKLQAFKHDDVSKTALALIETCLKK